MLEVGLLVGLRAHRAPNGTSMLAPHGILHPRSAPPQPGKQAVYLSCSKKTVQHTMLDKRLFYLSKGASHTQQPPLFPGTPTLIKDLTRTSSILPHISEQIGLQLQQRVEQEAWLLKKHIHPIDPATTKLPSEATLVFSAQPLQTASSFPSLQHLQSDDALSFALQELFSSQYHPTVPLALQEHATKLCQESFQNLVRTFAATMSTQPQRISVICGPAPLNLLVALWRLRLWQAD